MKKSLLYVGSVFILLLSAFIFVLPSTSIFQKNNTLPPFGKYDGKPIELTQGSDFANAVANYTEMYKNNGQQINDYVNFYIYNYAFNNALTTLAYTTEVKNSGYAPSKKAVSRTMLNYFLDSDGNYSADRYNAVSETDRNTLRNDITRSLTFARFYEDVFGSQTKLGETSLYGIKTSEAESSYLNSFGSTKRSFDLVAFDTNEYPEEEVKAFAEKNSELFEKYDLSVISFKDESQAKKVLAQLKNNEVTFADAVTEYSEKYYSGSDGKSNSTYEYQLKQIISDAQQLKSIVELTQDSLSDIVKTSNGYSVFKADGAKASFIFDDTSKSIVKSYINNYETSLKETYYTNRAADFKNATLTDGFDGACISFNVTKESIPAFAINYGNTPVADSLPQDIKALATASTNENFLTKAFSLKDGEVSEPISLGDYVVVIKMTGEQKDEVTTEDYTSTVQNFDQSSANSALFASDKVVNDFSKVYFGYLTK